MQSKRDPSFNSRQPLNHLNFIEFREGETVSFPISSRSCMQGTVKSWRSESFYLRFDTFFFFFFPRREIRRHPRFESPRPINRGDPPRFQIRSSFPASRTARRQTSDAPPTEKCQWRRGKPTTTPTILRIFLSDRFAGIRSKSVNLSSSSWEWNRILISNKLIVTVELACKPLFSSEKQWNRITIVNYDNGIRLEKLSFPVIYIMEFGDINLFNWRNGISFSIRFKL